MPFAVIHGPAIGLRHPVTIRAIHTIHPERWIARPLLQVVAEDFFSVLAHEQEVHAGQFHRPDDSVQIFDEFGSGKSLRLGCRCLRLRRDFDTSQILDGEQRLLGAVLVAQRITAQAIVAAQHDHVVDLRIAQNAPG